MWLSGPDSQRAGPDAEQKALGWLGEAEGTPVVADRDGWHCTRRVRSSTLWPETRECIAGGLWLASHFALRLCFSVCVCVPARVGGIVMVLVQKMDWGYWRQEMRQVFALWVREVRICGSVGWEGDAPQSGLRRGSVGLCE